MNQELIDEILAELRIEDLPNDELRDLAEIIGLEATVRMMCHWAGMQVRVPVTGLRNVQKKYVQAVYDGSNIGRIAQRLGITYRTVERYIKD